MISEEEKENIFVNSLIICDINSESVESTNPKSDVNNNPMLRRRNRRKTSTKIKLSESSNANLSSFEIGAKVVSTTVGSKAPSYVPSYVRIVNFESSRKSRQNSRSTVSNTSRRSRKKSNSPDPLRSNNGSTKKCKLKRSRVQLKGLDKRNLKYQEKYKKTSKRVCDDVKDEKKAPSDQEKMHVKAAVEAMEARIAKSTLTNSPPKPAKPAKPPGLASKLYRQSSNNGELSANSNSKPENSYQKGKNFWDQKANKDEESNMGNMPHAKNFKLIAEKVRDNLVDQKVTTQLQNPHKATWAVRSRDTTQPERNETQSNSNSTQPPALPPKLGRKSQNAVEIKSVTNHMTKRDMTSSTDTSNVTDKAKLFGGARRPSANKDQMKTSGFDSPPLIRHGTSGDDGSINKFNENQNKKSLSRLTSGGQITSYSRQTNDSEKNCVTSRLKRFENDSRSRSSTNSSMSDDSDKNNSFLHSNINKAPSKEALSKKFSGGISVKASPETPPKPLPKPKLSRNSNGSIPPRVSSALQSAIDNNTFESPKLPKKTSLPENVQKSFLNEMQNKGNARHKYSPRVPSSPSPDSRLLYDTSESSSGHASPEVPRKPKKLSLAKRTSSAERGSFSNELGSNGSSPRTSIIDKPSPQVPPRPKRPAPIAPPKRPPSSDRTQSSMSSSSEPSLHGDLNPSELYAKVEREIRAENGSTKLSSGANSLTRSRPDSTSSSTDSGIRTSLEIPGKSPNIDIASDFDHSDGDDSLIGHSAHNSKDGSSLKKKETTEVKLHNIAKELLATEESYVSVLHLIDQVFHKQISEAATQKHIIPEQIVNNIFCHVPAIYKFHSSFLLPQLMERIANWETKPQIGDIMTQAAPYLKMYSLYVQNFDEAMNTIKTWSEKSPAFNAIIQSIQKIPECNSLTLQHHMLGPVQRVPRYRLLLEDYVKRLPSDSADREKSEEALELITKAANHSNETMKKIEKFHKLVNVFSSLTEVNFDIVDVSRELMKEGKIIKISARNGEKSERYIYLFTDMLLCCTPLRIPLQGKTYKISARIDVEGMHISEVKNPTVANAFCVNGMQKSIEFATSSAEEKETWVEAIQNAIDLHAKNRQTFIKAGVDHTVIEELSLPSNDPPPGSPVHTTPHRKLEEHVIDIADGELGTRAPRWVKDHEVTMCMICSKAFHKLIRRRHHCRACGRVVCGECSENKCNLQYDPDKPQKVCTRCYGVLTGHRPRDSSDVKGGVLEVEADSVNSVIADYLFFYENDKKKTWVKTWCVIPQNELCLYFYGAHQDIKALMTLPLPGFEVLNLESSEHKSSFKLKQGRKIYNFASDDVGAIERWKYALRLASVGSDLTREDVKRLGKSPSSSDSEESEEGEWK